MARLDRRSLLGGFAAGGALAMAGGLRAQVAAAPPLDEAKIGALAKAFLDRFEVPGAAVAVVRPGVPAFTRGYGVRTLGKSALVDEHTLFGIASNSKAFTTASLAILVDEKKLAWDDPVIKYLPEFQMYDPAVTQMMTVRDLLVHRSGLGLGAGDLMMFPATDHSLADILRGLRYLKPESGFRAAYAYDNNMYLVAGMVLSRITGLSWEAFVTQRLLKPLGMNETVAGFSALKGDNIAGRHARLGPPVRGLGPMKVIQAQEQDKIDAAGGLNTSAHDVTAWFKVQLAQGKLPDGTVLWSEDQAREMWTPQTLTGNGPGPDAGHPTRSVLTAYALGWSVGQVRNQRILYHSGGLMGQVTQHVLLPELGCGIAVYTNEEAGYASSGLRNALIDMLVQATEFDWVATTAARVEARQADTVKATATGGFVKPEGGLSLPLAAYAGRYRDPWYGDIVVAVKGEGLSIDFTRTPEFKGTLEPWGKDAFRTHFTGDDIEDAVVTFSVADGKATRVTMKALSPLADFSFDFQDLDFSPV